MYLLILLLTAPALLVYANLHPTMYLLIPFMRSAAVSGKKNLHPTMYLLILIQSLQVTL